MKKRIVGLLASWALAAGFVVLGSPPAHACDNSQGWTYVDTTYGNDSIQAQLSFDAVAPGSNFTHAEQTTHYVGIGDQTNGTLVQAGYTINGTAYSYTYSFFYEFIGPNSVGPVDITSAVEASLGTPGNGINTGDLISFHIWYGSSTYWGLEIMDVRTGKHYNANIDDASSGAYIGRQPIVATEKDTCFTPYDLFNDGVMTVKQPEYHQQYDNWYFFESGPGTQHQTNLNDPVSGDIDETTTTANSNAYAYHTWKLPN